MLVRTAPFRAVGGFAEQMIAGEEAEFCFRLREKGFAIESVDREMTLHDAAITRFGQWWRRSVRTGHAYAECAHLHGGSPERLHVGAVRRAVLWGGVCPLLFVLGLVAGFFAPWTFLLPAAVLTLVVLMTVRIALRHRAALKGFALDYAYFVMLAKLPQFLGVMKFRLLRRLGRRSRLIEYK